MPRPNRGTGSAGPKRPGGYGNREQYSGGGKTITNTKSTTKSSKK